MIYDLKKLGLNRDEIDILSGLCQVMNKVRKTYDCMKVDIFGLNMCLKIEIYSNDPKLSEKDALNDVVTNRLVKDVVSPRFFSLTKSKVGNSISLRGPNNSFFNRCVWGFMNYGDPFSEEVFATERDNFIAPMFANVDIEPTALLSKFTDPETGEIKKPDRMMVLEFNFK